MVLAKGGSIRLEVEGRCRGVLLEQERGTSGFGYDPLFELPDSGRTLAELGIEAKRGVSHRGRALRALVRALQASGGLQALG